VFKEQFMFRTTAEYRKKNGDSCQFLPRPRFKQE